MTLPEVQKHLETEMVQTKAMTPEDLESIGTQIILGNTFHLFLAPGPELVEAARKERPKLFEVVVPV